MGAVTERLMELGFGANETRAYLALLELGTGTGYELAKASGIPRANIYKTLDKLELRGAVLRSEGPGGTRYGAVRPHELFGRLAERLQRTINEVVMALEEIGPGADQEQIWGLRGYPALLEHARGLIEAARSHLLLALYREEAQALAGVMARARDKGLAINTLCLAGCSVECGACQERVYRYPVAAQSRGRRLILITDDAEALAGEILGDEPAGSPQAIAGGLRTRQAMLVDLLATYVRHSVALAALLSAPGPAIEDSLEPGTKAALDAILPFDGDGAWIDQIRMRLQPGKGPAGEAPAQ